MSPLDTALSLLNRHFGPGPAPRLLSVPGRVNLIGEHIDYHDLPVLPMALQRRLYLAFRPRPDRWIRAISAGPYGDRHFEWTGQLAPGFAGDWANYLKAAAQAVQGRWDLAHGIDVAITSDLPPAAGLASSSALLTGITLALLQASHVHATFEELMDVLPDGEQFVGTRGGGMDHATVLGSRPGCALHIDFAPFRATPVPIPRDWAFLVAHSLTTAEKSGALRAEYNARRAAGTRAIQRLGFSSYAQVIDLHTFEELQKIAKHRLDGEEQRCFLHVTGEAFRVRDALAALREARADGFGQTLDASHQSLRDLLRVSCPALDELVEEARQAGALGARLTGAGFGGCAVIFCSAAERERIAAELVDRYYTHRRGFNPEAHLIPAEASPGALFTSTAAG